MSRAADPSRRGASRLLRALLFAVLTFGALGAGAGAAVAQTTVENGEATTPAGAGGIAGVEGLPETDRGGGLVDQLVESPAVPDVTFAGEDDDDLSRSVAIILIVGLASLAPTLVLLATTFTRFIVVLSLMKNALALQTVPPAQVLVGLSLFLTAFTMAPTFTQINEIAVQPLLAGEVDQAEAFTDGFEPLKTFMLAQVRDEDLELFVELADQGDQVQSREDVPALTLIPAFVISELRTAFTIGFVVFVPFLLIDIVVATVLMSMGMVMVPPVFISLPLKLLLFVLVDGWVLLIGALVQSVQQVGVT